MKNTILIAVILIGFFACSSAPPQKEEQFDKRNLAAEYLEFGNKYFRDAMYDQASRFYQLAEEYYSSVDDQTGLVTAYNSLGKTYSAGGNDETASLNYKKAYDLAKKQGKPELLLQGLNNLGEIRLKQGNYKEALSFFTEGLQTEGLSAPGKELAVLHHNRAVALKALGRLDEAADDAEKARALNLGEKRYEELASNYYLLASIRSKARNYSEALKNAELALEYDKKTENSPGIAQDLSALGLILEKSGKPEEAYEMYKRSFLVYRSLRLSSGIVRTLELLEACAKNLNKPEEADQYREARNRLQSKG